MNKTTLEGLEEALERLEQIDGVYSWGHLLFEVREALAEQNKQEPVAIVVEVDRHGDATVVSGAWQLDGGKHTFYVAPVSAEAIRAEALEEAAKVCDEPSYIQQRAKTSAECAAAIRGMK